jgi:hypothetical protein
MDGKADGRNSARLMARYYFEYLALYRAGSCGSTFPSIEQDVEDYIDNYNERVARLRGVDID